MGILPFIPLILRVKMKRIEISTPTEYSRAAKLAPRIGIVVPVYKHPVLVDEAIRSAIEQREGISSVIVAVNDGCPMAETDMTLRCWAEAYPDRVAVTRRPNGGLSAARNTGVRYLLRNYPSVEGVFMLDADNLLDPNALRVFAELLERYPDDDWFYPHQDMFGLVRSWSSGGPYSLLIHSVQNICDAGSLIRRRVFEAGIRFDESMLLGYEDWEFWLAAAKRGFRGRYVKAPFFRYRKRPESMVSGSHRNDVEIKGYIRRKHNWLYGAQTILALEHEETPRYRIIFADSGRILALTDPLQPGKELTADAFAEEVWSWIAIPSETAAGAFWVTTTESVWELLRARGLLRFALWDLERRLGDADLSTLLLGRNENGGLAIAGVDGVEQPIKKAAMAAMPTSLARPVLEDSSEDWIDQIGSNNPPQKLSHRALLLDAELVNFTLARPVMALSALFTELRRSRWRKACDVAWSWRGRWEPFRTEIALRSRNAAQTGVLRPAIPRSDGVLSVCFLLPFAEFGGVETVAFNVAVELRKRGFSTALCMVGTKPIRLAGDVAEAFDEVMWFPEQKALSFGGPVYQGTHLPAALETSLELDLMGLLAGFDCVIGCHPVGAINAFAQLRRAGVVTVLHEHLFDVTAHGRELGHPVIALAYEAGVDIVATCSRNLRDRLHARGIPDSKLIVVPNAPGYRLSAERQATLLKARAAASADHPLRVLFMGRFDRQKGIDRLVAIITRLRRSAVSIDWRVVGKVVVEGDADVAKLSELVELQPPVYTVDERTALFAWADVVLLPSRFEGLPLTVLEAQRCGIVPLVAQAGAVTEAVHHDVDGLVVSQEDCVAEMVAALEKLASDRQMLARLSKRAAEKKRSWEESTAPLVERIEAEVARRRHIALA